MSSRTLLATLITLVLAAGTGPARAAVLSASTGLAPGQSGFVSLTGLASGTGSIHLYDQLANFTAFRWKPAAFGQPGTTERVRPGLTITRDEYGVPSVRAADEHDMWVGAGYAVAEDRLFQLDVFRRATEGTLSELVGKSRLDDDRIVRRDFYRPAELDAMFAALPSAFQDRFTAYRDGINLWADHVRADPRDLPAEFAATAEPVPVWTVRDSLAIGVYLARTIPTNADPESLELSNLRGVQLGGLGALDALVPLRTPRPLTTIPAREGRFPSQPGRTRSDERAGARRSARFAATLPVPGADGAGALITPAGAAASARQAGPLAQALSRFQPRLGGSYMFAARRADGHAFLFNGPQLGFDAPEKVLELELHAPGIDVRGMTAPGAPVIAAGFNRHVAFGITTGASDTDDLYAEQLVPGRPEQYRFEGRILKMDCRTDTIAYRSPPSDLLAKRVPDAGSRTVRLCRTIHGPVQERAGNVAYARRFSTWKRELQTLSGLAAVNTADTVQDVDRAARKLTWNENLMAIDDRGHIGFWHPGLSPLRPRGWDERLPYPGTGEAEWRGLLPASRMPRVIDPRQGWLANWNNLPSAGWTAGDGTARKRLDGPFFRAGWLARLVRGFAKAPSIPAMQGLLRRSATVAQQYPIATSRLRRARRAASGPARTVLETLRAWDGSFDRTGPDGTVDPGVATWDAFRAAAAAVALAPFGDAAPWLARDDALAPLYGAYHRGPAFHLFDATHAESYALGHLAPAGLRAAAAQAAGALARRFGTTDPARWRERRRLYRIGAVGAASPPSIPFLERGTYEQLIEAGPG